MNDLHFCRYKQKQTVKLIEKLSLLQCIELHDVGLRLRNQWRRLQITGRHAFPLLQLPGTWGRHREYSRTRNNKLTKLYNCPPRKRSPKRMIVLVEPKKWRGTSRTIFTVCAPHFRIRSGVAVNNTKWISWYN